MAIKGRLARSILRAGVCIVLAVALSVSAAAFRYDVVAPEGNVSYEVTINLSMDAQSFAYAGVQFTSTVSDPDSVVFVGFTNGVSGTQLYNTINNIPGRNSFGFYTSTNRFQDAMNVGSVKFTYFGTAEQTITIEMRIANFDEEGRARWITTEASYIVVNLSTEETFSQYDINKDGDVGLLDLALAAFAAGTAMYIDEDLGIMNPLWDEVFALDSKGGPVTAAMCDVNEDGVVDMLDLMEILRNFAF